MSGPATVTPTEGLVPVVEHVVRVGGIRNPYLHAGSADAEEAIVFVHGNPGPAADWRRLIACTGAFARAVPPDLPGIRRRRQARSLR